MTADPLIRAQRRQLELMEKGELIGLEEIAENLKMRDHIDTHRTESPLRQAEDAVYIDNSLMTLDEQVELVVRLADERITSKLRKREMNKEK